VNLVPNLYLGLLINLDFCLISRRCLCHTVARVDIVRDKPIGAAPQKLVKGCLRIYVSNLGR